ncbi:hypothetical protein [Georgenia yuyongxinii]
MALITGGVFLILLLLGKPAGEAGLYALLLACPLMMVGMMFGGHRGHGAGEGDSGHQGHVGHGSQQNASDSYGGVAGAAQQGPADGGPAPDRGSAHHHH